jgi:AraC family transcriptional regulator
LKGVDLLLTSINRTGEVTEPSRGGHVLGIEGLEGFKASVVAFEGGLRIPRHHHETACLSLILAGRFLERHDRHDYTPDVGTILAKPAGEPHACQIALTGSRQVILEYDLASLEMLPPSHPFDDFVNRRSSGGYVLGRRIEQELQSNDEFSPLAVEGLAMELIALAGRNPERVPKAPPRWLSRVRDLLHERFLEAPRCQELAEESGVHPATLSRAFRSCYGVGMAEYARRLRLEWAARELAGTERPIVAIALDAGFADQSHFTRWFRRFSGFTPREYRLTHGR